ncbi:TonB-dependent receptor [Eilatimonas milleporae]|uniref:Iron complex outermembrane receptor protein n=1 Tax=Eilatimonas milleporae TaxID=911205 RepID=A0A3M0CIA2_9PROT|nr:TonB-dependent receptor [Eilatimonas milleporae]RMB08487.1 iron complex outermembrane receptor protein [Eilatimonas milleporae]
MKSFQPRRHGLLSTVAVIGLVCVGGTPAQAQQNSVSGADSASAGLEEITVTARRRAETLQDVPISVTAFDGDQLTLMATQDIVELAKFSPNVTLEVSRGTNTTLTAFIRGVGQQDPVAGFEPGVGLYIDDVYLNRPQAAVLDIYDVERIEVLRGPQGTLYGRNTIGGAIKYVTKRLSDEPELQVRGAVGAYDQLDLIVTGSAPITDTLRIGGTFATLNRDGFGENLVLDDVDNYNKQIMAARASLEWTPAENVFVRLSGDYIDDDSDPRQGHRLIPSASGEPVLNDVFDTRAGLNTPTQEVQMGGIALNIEWEINENWTVKNILAYREDESSSPIDFDSLPVADVDVPVDYENDQFSEELQILYQDDKFSGLLGFYYLDANAFNAFEVLLGTTGDLIGVPGLNALTLGDVGTETWAIFGDFTYDLTETVSLSVGGRFTHDERTSQILRQTLAGGFSERFGGAGTVIATTSDFNGSETYEEFNPRASISWQPTEEHNFYFTYSEGFKGGSFDPRGQSTAAPDLDGDGDIDNDDIFEFLRFEPEEVEMFELGWKAALFDRRLLFSIAGFLSNYTNVQIPGSIGVDTTGDGVNDSFIGITSNAGDADINGIEFEGQALLSTDLTGAGDGLNFAWTLGYLDAEFNEFIDAFGNDVADQRVFQNTPDWTLSGNLTYSRPLSFGGTDGLFSVINTVAYRSAASQFEEPNPFLDQPGFALWDASLVWESDDGRLQFGLHAKNITDKEYIVAGYNFITPGPDGALIPNLGTEGTLTAFYGNPRTVLGTFQIRF